jgi:hypothetical protein
MGIEEMTEKELLDLKEKIQQREKELNENKKNKEIEKTKKFLDSVDIQMLLEFMPHSRHSCKEGRSINGYFSDQGYADCQRCHFVEIIEDHKSGINDFSVKLNVTFEKIE